MLLQKLIHCMKYRIRWENKNFDDMGTLNNTGMKYELQEKQLLQKLPLQFKAIMTPYLFALFENVFFLIT